MLAAMNGHLEAVTLLLDRGADINAQIETNKNTALTLACFQVTITFNYVLYRERTCMIKTTKGQLLLFISAIS